MRLLLSLLLSLFLLSAAQAQLLLGVSQSSSSGGGGTPAPTVTSVSPNIGLTAGGTSVAVGGTNLTGATAVKFGSTDASSYVVNSSISITATSPAVAASTVDITVTTPGGTSATSSADQFTFNDCYWNLVAGATTADVDLDFSGTRYCAGGAATTTGAQLAITRADTCNSAPTNCATDLLYSDPAGRTYNAFASGALRITSGRGLLIEGSSRNIFHNAATPATQTITFGVTTYTLWVNCAANSPTCSATMSAGTATGCGTGVATQGVYLNVTITVGGTCTITIAGTAAFVQVEQNALPTSGILTGASATNIRANEAITLAGAAKTDLQSNNESFILQGGGDVVCSGTTRLFSATTNTSWLSRTSTNAQSNITALLTPINGTGSFCLPIAQGPMLYGFGTNGSGRYVVSGNGAVSSDANSPAASQANYWLGSQSGTGSFINAYISRFTVWNTEIASATLAPLTAPVQPFDGTAYATWGSQSQAASPPTAYADMGQVLQYEYTQAWTVMTSIQVGGTAGGGAQIIFSNVNTSPAFPGYEFWIDGSAHLHVRLINVFGTPHYIGVNGGTSVVNYKQYEVAASYDGSGTAAGVKIYLNGVLESLTTESDTLAGNSIVSSPQHWALGNQVNHNTGATSYALLGGIDNFRLYNVVKDATFISTYSVTSPPPCDSDAQMCLNFAETSGATITDTSTNAFVGTVVNQGSWSPWTPPGH